MASRSRLSFVVPAFAGIALIAARCGGEKSGIAATLADFSITLSSTSVPTGTVTFDVTNRAEQPHEFVVLKTDVSEDQLPTDDAGNVDEAGDPGIEVVDEIEGIEGGSTQSLTAGLDAGNYVLICNLPGHYSQGMHTTFTVT